MAGLVGGEVLAGGVGGDFVAGFFRECDGPLGRGDGFRKALVGGERGGQGVEVARILGR